MSALPPFRIQLDQYRGPIELLLYLVKKREVEVGTVSLQTIAEQYLAYLDTLEDVDIDQVGDFLEVASLLVEAKLHRVLPRTEIDETDFDKDPREDLVQRLLLYKEFKDVSLLLEEQSRKWQERYPRLAEDLPPRKIAIDKQPVEPVELWDLVSSYGRVLKQNTPRPDSTIILDETPVHIYMQRIRDQLIAENSLQLSQLMEPGMHKSSLVGIFLAILELVRHHHVETAQVGDHGEIRISLGNQFSQEAQIEETDY